VTHPPVTTRVLLWRHGRTAWNAERRIQGQHDIPLDDIGRGQARLTAGRLAALGPTVIVSSDLRRAADTAAELGAITGLPVRFDVRLRERGYGDWQGRTTAEIEQRWPEEYARWRAGDAVDACGVESLDDVAKRVYGALTDLVATHPGATIAVATHGGAARRGIGALLDWPPPIVRTLGDLRNCHWSELRHEPDRGWRLWTHNAA
jgi:glucosyl-3-phosphoglycerate phosphatase